jgi:hypothetical protein
MRDKAVERKPPLLMIIIIPRWPSNCQLRACISAVATSENLHLSHLFGLINLGGVLRKGSCIIWLLIDPQGMNLGHGNKPNLHRVVPMAMSGLSSIRQQGVTLNSKR